MSSGSYILLAILYISYTSYGYQRESHYILQFFANDTDRLRSATSQLLTLGQEIMHKFTETKSGILFSGVFTNNTVLQREPHYASIYGTCDTSNITIILSIKNEDNQTFQNHSTISQYNGDWKISFPRTYPNGGNYTLIAYCNECLSNPKSTTIYNIIFGDIYLCSGQSNMNLEMDFTFNAKHTYNNITELDKYSNIRFFTKRSYAVYDNVSSYIIPAETQIINGKYQWHSGSNIHRVKLFSATCWYTAQSLIDMYNMSDINFGLMLSGIDGSQIEPWIMNHTVETVCDASKCKCPDHGHPPPNCFFGALFNGMIKPFVNMSIKAFLWYQGENNVLEQEMGIVNDSIYVCLQTLMIRQYRMIWNDSTLPFGIVQMAAGDSEGHKRQMPYFRHSQTGNYGIVPNEKMQNVFIAQAYDIGDPWFTHNSKERSLYPAPYDWNTTKWFLGSIHPRAKLYVGQRMARNINRFVYNASHIWNGPLIKGCHLDVKNALITIYFHENMLYDETIIIQPLDLWYNKSLEKTVKYYSTIQLLIDETWIYLDGMNILNVNGNGYGIIVNVSSIIINTTEIWDINGISYAWSDYPCCGNLDLRVHPCPMNMCPVITSKSRLPALPFQARIVNNKCQCTAPQKCDGSSYVYPGVYVDAIPTTTQEKTTTTQEKTTTTQEKTTTTNTESSPEFICVSLTELTDNSNINGMQGEYQKNDEFMLYWTKVADEHNKYDIFYIYKVHGSWEIGSVEDANNNLLCNVNTANMDSPVECDKWVDYNSKEINYIILTNDKCKQVDTDTRSLDEPHNIFADKIKITAYSILGELLCIIVLCIYCNRKIMWRNITHWNNEQQLHALVTSDQNTEIDVQRLNPVEIDQALDHGGGVNDNQQNPLID